MLEDPTGQVTDGHSLTSTKTCTELQDDSVIDNLSINSIASTTSSGTVTESLIEKQKRKNPLHSPHLRRYLTIKDVEALATKVQEEVAITFNSLEAKWPTECDETHDSSKISSKVPDSRSIQEIKSYRPRLFAKIRACLGIDATEYALSFTKTAESSISGKSGAQFYVTENRKYLMKIIRSNEKKLILDNLVGLCSHYSVHPKSYLVACLGLYTIALNSGAELSIMIMKNLTYLGGETDPHNYYYFYDLKGSLRTAGICKPPSSQKIVLDDNDWKDRHMALHLSHQDKARFLKHTSADIDFLTGMGAMDYSLLVAVSKEDAVSTRSIIILGIVDIWTRYGNWKWAESTMKRIQYGAGQASAVEPTQYATRFKKFLAQSVDGGDSSTLDANL